VIAGIRSANPIILSSIARRLAEKWKAAFSVVFKTNQATGCHLSRVKNISELRPYDSTVVRGRVVGPPTVLKGGHVILKLVDTTGEVACAIYSETGLQKIAKLLRDGDSIEVGGGVQPRSHGITLNAEYLRILETPPLVKLENPRCPRCGRRLKSSGKGKGFKCEVCGFKTHSSGKIEVKIPRFLDPGLYLQRPLAYRHLSPPAEVLGTTPLPAPPIPELVVWPHPA
jgi:tRNA(Ile2)-agmatinylcytidine synthase